MQENCELLRHCFILENTDDAPSSFIQDKQHLESVLGQSQDLWFESLTARQIQCQKSSSVRPKCTVFDSPSCSPTVSQMLSGHLSVGSSPSVLRHSSPAPHCEREESFIARLSLGTPQSDDSERPLPYLSPGPSPIVDNKSILSHPSSSGVYSLGLDDSNLSWSNSLATPPRDPEQMDMLTNGTYGTNSPPTRTKDTARALFSPGNRQDTSADSVLPLDSTFEDDQSDLDGSGSDFSQKNVDQSDKNGGQIEEIKQIDNLKIKFKKRVISRKDSLTNSSKKIRFKNGSNSCDLDDNDSTKKTKLNQETVTESISSTDSQDYSSSPTFSQKSKRSKVRSCKPQTPPSGNERSFIEDVLSDFFDPPAASVGKRKPAPSRKRKSLEMEDNDIPDNKSSSKDLCESSGSAVDISTPKGSLHPILASDKKTKSSSNKKVRFSDNVQKCTFIPEHDTFYEKRAHRKSGRKKMINTKEKTKTFVQHNSSPCDESFKNKQYVQVKESESEVENEKSHKKSKSSKIRSDLKADIYNGCNQRNGDTTYKCSVNCYQNNKRQSSEFVENNITDTNQINRTENQKVNIAVRKDKETDKGMRDPSVSGVSEENSEELFSQVSPSALKEMCNVAEKPVTSEEIKGKDVTIREESSDTGKSPQKPLKVKRFFYPSVSHISNATSTKVFKFREDDRKEMNRKVLLSSVKLEDVVDTELNISIDSMKQSKEVDEELPEHVENVTDNKVIDKPDIAMQKMVMDNVLNKSSHLQTQSTTSMEVLEELSDTPFRSEKGFQTAAGKQFSVSDQALKKATALLLEDGSHTTAALEPLCNLTKDPKDLHHSVTVPTSMVKGVIKDKPHVELFTELNDSDGHAPQGGAFKSASGKDVHISAKALIKASAVFNEDLPDSKSGLSCISSSESIRAGALTQSEGENAKIGAEYKANTVSSIPPQTLEKEKYAFHSEKSKNEIIKNQIQSKIISLPVSDTNMCNGFQFASGKEIQLLEKALEKAASLLQEENTEFTPLNDSKMKKKTDVNAEYGIEDALIEDIEFSEWCEEDMEPDENLHIVPIEKDWHKTMNGNEILEEQKENVLKRNRHGLDYIALANSETKIHASTKEVTQTEEIDVNKESLVMLEITDKSPKLGKACLEKSVNNNDNSEVNRWHDRAEKGENLKASFPTQVEENIKTNTEEDSDSNAPVKDKDVNGFQSKQTVPYSDSNFVGFQTAGGRSLSFSAEKLKHAEKLLDDSETAVTQTLSIQLDHDEKKLIVRNPKNLCKKNSDNEEIRSNLVRSKKIFTLTDSSDVNRQSVNTLVFDRDSQVKNDTFSVRSGGIQKNIAKEFDKMSVAERLMFEFENDMVDVGKQNNDLKCVEKELKHLADFKISRMDKKGTVKLLSAPAETSKKVPFDRNVPKGFRPFKPPKITEFSSHEKHTKPVVNGVEYTKPSHTESINSERFNQMTSTKDISLKTTMKKKVLYPESKLKIWEQSKDSSENLKHITKNDNIKSTNNINTEGNTKIANPFSGSGTINKHESDKTDACILDLEGMSQLFEDDMDFTQTANCGMNVCTENQSAAKDKNKDSNTIKEEKENSLRVLDSEGKPYTEDINCTESMPSKNSNCIGFSTASGISVSVSASAFESAVKMLSKFDEKVNTQNCKQRDLINDEDKMIMATNINEKDISSDSVNDNNCYPSYKVSNLSKIPVTSECEQTSLFKKEQKQSVCLFQTAIGKLVDISSKALNVARKTLNGVDYEKNTHSSNSKCVVTTMVGDSVVPECAVDYSKPARSEKLESIHQSVESENGKNFSNVPKEWSVPVSSGCNKAFEKKIEVLETALKHAESTMADDEDISEKLNFFISGTEVGDKDLSEIHVDQVKNPESAEAMFPDFRTMSGSIVKASENSSKKAKENLSEIHGSNKHLEDEMKSVGVCTSSGKNVQVSKEAFKHAKACLLDSDRLKLTPESKKNLLTFDKEDLSMAELTVEPLIHSKLHKTVTDGTVENQGLISNYVGFNTALGKTVKISEKSLKHAKQSLQTSDLYENTRPEPEAKFPGFSTASEKTVMVSERALKYAEESLVETSDLMKSSEPETKFQGFSTASGKIVTVSEKAFKHAKESFVETSFYYESPEPGAKFQGSGNSVQISEQASKDAKESFVETSKIHENPEPETKFQEFSTAFGKTVQISEKTLKHAKESLVEKVNLHENQEPESKFVGFSTASGKTVQISEQALKRAKKSLVEKGNLHENPEPDTKFQGFSTASGKTVQISEQALKHIKESLVEKVNLHENPEPDTKFQGFSTASGKTIQISEQALKHAKKSLVDKVNVHENPEPDTKFQGFSTASGKTVQISEKALKHAKVALVETINLHENQELETKFQGFSTASGKTVQISEQALKHAKESLVEKVNLHENQEPESKFVGFSTASGKTVQISEQALKRAKKSLVEKGNLHENPEPDTKFQGFSTASGKTVQISEQALKHAKESLVETINLHENQELETNFKGFKTAFGYRMEVSNEVLEKVKEHLPLTETTGFQGFDPKLVGFSTALGNKVEVSEKALMYVKKNLSEKDCLNRDNKAETRFSGFCTASGKTVEVSETALMLATDSLDKIPEGVDGVNQFNMNHTATYSEKKSNLHQGNKIEQVHGNAETEIGDTDFEEMFGMALKRRKLDMSRERRMVQNLKDEDSICKRKAVKNTPKGNADQRHPGFRPFKPVFCKAVDKQQRRQDVSAVSHCGKVTKNAGSNRPSYPAPFKTMSEKPTALSSLVSSTKQEVIVKTCSPKSVSNQGQGDGEVTKSDIKPLKTCLLPSGDCQQKLGYGMEEGIQTQHTSVVSDFIKSEAGKMQEIEENANQLGSKIDAETPVNIQDGTPECESDVSKESKAGIIEETVKSFGLDTTQASDHGDFDSFSQDEDDVYYCTLVEARRHQDNIIKQRGADRVRPVAGRLWKMKQTQNRWKLKDLIDDLGQEKHRSDVNVTSGSAGNHKFLLEFHYGKNTAHVTVGDGAYLVPDDSREVGKQEFYRAFLTMEGIDAGLVSEAWVYNHYRWIVWKLAAYEKTSTCLHLRCLTPEMVMLQLKYRYDREIDLSQRSAVKKIYERDDTPCKRLVLCVSAVKRHDQNGSTVDLSKTVLDEKVILELTDGWYSIPAQIDSPLTQLALRGKIKVGHKLCVTGAELVGGEDACTPLEATSSVMLRICRNSTRPAPWDSVLGYQNDPRPLCVPLSDIHCDGGIVGVVDVVIVRKYPTLFMEKFEGGGCIFRTGRCEDRARQEYEVKKQSEMEKLYRQMENMVEKEQKQEKKVRQRKKFSRTEIEELQSGLDIFEALEEAGQPDMVQNYLNDHQLSMLYEYQRQLQEQKQVELNSRFQKAWQEKLEVFQERSVTPVLKFRVAGCANRDLDQSTSTILTVWRPAEEISELQEGHRYKIYSLSASASRSKYTGHIVQLTATKQTRFRHMLLDVNMLDTVYEPREVLWVVDIKRRQSPYGELDFVGIVVNITQSSLGDRMCDTVYLADCQTGILAVKFWNGYKAFGEDLFVVGSVLCCSNLMDKSSHRSFQIPAVEVSPEFTHITNKSQNTAQRKAVDKLLAVAKDKKAFMEKASAVLEHLLNENVNQNIPKKILGITNDFIKEFPRSDFGKQSLMTCQTGSGSISRATNTEKGNSVTADENQEIENISVDDRRNCKSSVDLVPVSGKAEISQTDRHVSVLDSPDVCTPVIERKRSIAQAKMAQLMTYGSPSILSPLSTAVSRSVTKGFKPPAVTKGFKPPAFKKL